MFSHERLQIIAISIIFGIITLSVAIMWWPFLKLLILAAILAILFLPIYEWFEKRMKNEPFAAISTIFVILLIVILPLYAIGQLMFNELIVLYDGFKSSGFELTQSHILANLPSSLQGAAINLFTDLGSKLSGLAGHAFSSVSQALSSAAGFLLSFFLAIFTTYYFLRDGKKIKIYFNSIFPLSKEHENILVSKLTEAVSGVVKGSFLVALIQGVLATIGFIIFGLPAPFLWGAFTVLAALVPNVGTSLSIIPAIIYLFATGATGSAIGLIIWGALAVGTIDNIVSPKLIGSKTKLHPLLVLFSILGGIKLFGFIGFLLGPILMSVFVTLLEIYRIDMKKYLER